MITFLATTAKREPSRPKHQIPAIMGISRLTAQIFDSSLTALILSLGYGSALDKNGVKIMDSRKALSIIHQNKDEIHLRAEEERERDEASLGRGSTAVFGMILSGVQFWISVGGGTITLIAWRQGEEIWHAMEANEIS